MHKSGGFLDSRKPGGILMAGFAVLLLVIATLLPRVPQPSAYHNFADHRGWLGIPNFGDVTSNAGFAIVGIMGLVALRRRLNPIRFLDQREKWPDLIIFFGLLLTAGGRTYCRLGHDKAGPAGGTLPLPAVFYHLVRPLGHDTIH